MTVWQKVIIIPKQYAFCQISYGTSIFGTIQALCCLTGVDSLVITITCIHVKHPRNPSDYLAAVTSSALFQRHSHFQKTRDKPQELKSVCHALGEKQRECELSVAEHITSHLPAFRVTKFVFSLSDNCLSAQRAFYTRSADLTGSFVGLHAKHS